MHACMHTRVRAHTQKLTSTGVFEADRSAPASPNGSKGSFLAVTNQMKKLYKLVTQKQKTNYFH